MNVTLRTAEAGLTLGYQSGFGNGFETEALPGALPVGRNSPQRCAYGLYAEQLSGSPFTAPRASNERSWLYRIRPTVQHWGRFTRADAGLWRTAPCAEVEVPPAPMRWDPLPLPDAPQSFIEGIRAITTAGDVGSQSGMGAHIYLATRSMQDEYFYNADGELLIVPESGRLRLCTEFGTIDLDPGEVAVIPRGVKFRAELPAGPARGYVCENYGAQFRLPELGPIGSNGLANARDFLAPVAAFEDAGGAYEIVKKYGGRFWRAPMKQSPFNVVAWHGNLAPVKYDTANFMTIGSISFDHPDPSIFTVLTSPSDTPGTANCDFVIFPPRWLVMENTFRPPWYHRNLMSEFMGLVYGEYDAKPGGFKPGGASLHNMMVPHGPDEEAFDKASHADLKPQKLDNTLAFMFESRFRFIPTQWAMQSPVLDHAYADCWAGLKDQFKS